MIIKYKHLQGQHDQSSHTPKGYGNAEDSGKAKGSGKGNIDPHIAGITSHVNAQVDIKLAKYHEFFYGRKPVSPELAAEFEAEARAKLTSMLSQTKVCIRVPPTSLDKILDDGRIKSQFETQESGGLLNNNYRAKIESDLYGISKDSDVVNRPIYGYLADELHAGDSQLYGYGSVILEMNDTSVRDRTTVTGYDSLDRYLSEATLFSSTPSMLNDPKMISMLGTNGTGNIDLPSKRGEAGYIEAQIHGSVSLADIKRIWLPDSKSSKIQEKRIRAIAPNIDIKYKPTGKVKFPN